ncbi:hypothetical protein SAMN06265795_10312 [Noviherbaspirillum humi]|uniref:Uncharacterized protein n=1 Tax=Noviherbaspirillum humi TaxID=1688639 RepID=A0A239ETA6_9BURK|nr:hypothetical protein [Noviherbaspirillum humi]SNS47990.1 hypothetical protein SAMN06265795_10312 [Noviherbaspirillum humi]
MASSAFDVTVVYMGKSLTVHVADSWTYRTADLFGILLDELEQASLRQSDFPEFLGNLEAGDLIETAARFSTRAQEFGRWFKWQMSQQVYDATYARGKEDHHAERAEREYASLLSRLDVRTTKTRP